MAVKHQRQPAPDNLTEAVTAANDALSERARLEALRPTLSAEVKAAVIHRGVMAEQLKAAELEAILSGEPPTPELVTGAAAARRALELATNTVTRLEHAIGALPTRLALADDGLTAARLRLDPLLQEARQAGIADFEREVITATAPLVALAARWRARTAGLGIASQFLTELRVPALTTAVPILSGRATLALDGTTVTLDDVWQSDSDAVAMFREGQSLSHAAAALDSHSNRIGAERQAAEIEARNNRPTERQKWRHDPPSHPMPPGPRFIPNSWSSTLNIAPAQIPADRVLTGTAPAATVGREIGQPFQPSAGIRLDGAGVGGGAGSRAGADQ